MNIKIIIYIFLVSGILCQARVAAQVVPTNRWVSVYSEFSLFNGQPVPVGAVIEVYDAQGILCGSAEVPDPGRFGFIPVYGDDPRTVGIDEGAEPGDTLFFRIDGFFTRSAGSVPIWEDHGTTLPVQLESRSNWPPVIEPVPDQVIWEGDLFTPLDLDELVSDPDDETATLSWEAVGQQEISVVIIDRKALISVPYPDWFGTESFRFIVSDPGGLSDTSEVTCLVHNVNDAPRAVDDLLETNEDQSIMISILQNDSDMDGTIIASTVTVPVGPKNGAFIAASDGTILYNPDPDYFGRDSLYYRVADDSGMYSNDALVDITVLPVNDPPVISAIPDQTILEEAEFSVITLDDYVLDADDADPVLVWSFTGADELEISITDRVVHVRTPNLHWNGSETVVFTAADPEGLTDSDTVMFRVVARGDPPRITSIPDQNIDEGGAFDQIVLDDFVTDPDHDRADLNWTWSGNHFLLVGVVDRIASIAVPDQDWYGKEDIVFRVNDPDGLFDTDTVRFVVAPVNDPPVVTAIPGQVILEGDTFKKISLDQYVNDPDHADKDLSWTFSGNRFLEIIIEERIVSIAAPDSEWSGIDTVRFCVNDPAGSTGADTVVFSVLAVNDAPEILELTDQKTEEGQMFPVLDLDAVVFDPDNSKADLNWSISGAEYLNARIENRQLFVESPDTTWCGSESLTLKVTDPQNAFDTGKIKYIIIPHNDPPRITGIPELSIPEDDSLSCTLSDFRPYIRDPDTEFDSLNMSMRTGNFVQVEQYGDEFRLYPSHNWFGYDSLLVTVNDGDLSDSAFVFVHVAPINDPPEIDLPDTLRATSDTSMTIQLKNYIEDVDHAYECLSFDFRIDNGLIMFSFDSVQSLVRFEWARGYNGGTDFYVTVRDDSGAAGEDSVYLSIDPVTGLAPGLLVSSVPASWVLEQNYPNPFNPQTFIRFGLPSAERVRLEVFDINGMKVRTLVDSPVSAGFHEITFDGENLSSGLYFYCLRVPGRLLTRKMILVK